MPHKLPQTLSDSLYVVLLTAFAVWTVIEGSYWFVGGAAGGLVLRFGLAALGRFAWRWQKNWEPAQRSVQREDS